MKSILFPIIVVCILTIKLIGLPGATAQCLSENDDVSRPPSKDLTGILDFNLRLFHDLVPKDAKRNFLFSPYSIWNALVLAYYGSGGQTEAQLKRVLGLDDKITTLQKWRAMEYVYKMRSETTTNNTFIVANKAYFDKDIRLRPCMEDILHNEMETIDFGQPVEAAYAINKFVSNTTRGTIDKLVSSDDLISANLVLVNAALFKGSWDQVFDKSDTRKVEFTGFDSTKYLVDMMVHPTGEYNWAMNEKLQTEILELPYAGKKISLLVFLPYKKSISNFNNVVQGLSMNNFESAISQLTPRKMSVNIPKFKLETYCGDELLRALVKMGITDAFSPAKANFAAFTIDKHQMSLDRSIHKAFIDVNEEGTVAGAATAIISTKVGGFSAFICNRPFIFIIRDNETKNLLFMGVYKSSDQISTGALIPTTGGDPNIEQNRDNINPIDWNNETPGKIVPPIDRNKEYTPNSGTNLIPDQNVTQFGIKRVKPPVRGINPLPERNQPPIDRNNEYTPNRGINSPPERDQPPVDRNNEYTPNRGINSPPERGQPPVDRNNEYTPNRGINSPPERGQPPVDRNNEYTPNRGINSPPERGQPPVEYTPIRETISPPERNQPPPIDRNRENLPSEDPERNGNSLSGIYGNANTPVSGVTHIHPELHSIPFIRHYQTTFIRRANANRRQTVPRPDGYSENTPRRTETNPEGTLTSHGHSNRRIPNREGSPDPSYSVNVDYTPIRETIQRPDGSNRSPEQANAFNLPISSQSFNEIYSLE